ncbi:hypothetical protein AG0111_0g12022 [Alternaria gaisen]|uniref:Uncharacterized protein n=1 Tax=Alternaria gaisen TaxID=167740 RepID=A0ACB6F6A3_9PLEO|nr:hypothetical protein AG0111_0g12022 [Alternaria gaisen]
MALYTIFLAYGLLSPLANALLNNLPVLNTITTETWLIPRLDMHMMSIGTGIPGNPSWPEDSKFDSTINFDVMVPAATGLAKWNCQGAMANGTITERLIDCKYDGLGERRAELSFSLWLYRNKQDGDLLVPTSSGHTAITANDAKEPTSYLTCLQGKPFDGLRCKIKSYLSVNKELVIEWSAA